MFFRLLPWEYAIRNLFRRPLRTALTFTGLTMVIVLVFVLSLRLRQREIATMFALGCSRMMIGRLMAAEIVIILLLAAGFTLGSVATVSAFGDRFVRLVITR